MTTNKSIDGLTTHTQKVTAKKPNRYKGGHTAEIPAKKPATAIPVTIKKSKHAEPLDPLAAEVEDLEINVVDDTAATKPIQTIEEETISVTINPEKSEKPEKTSEAPKSQTVEDFLAPVQAFDFDAESGKLEKSKKSMKKATKTPEKTEKTKEPDEKPAKKPKKEKKKLSKKQRLRRVIIAIVIFLVLIAGAGLALVLWGNDIIAKITGGQGSLLDLLTFTEETYEPLKTDENGRTNILAFGTEGYDMDGTVGSGTHDGSQLTDSIMLISLNQETGDIAMISLPRDLKASPTCTATGKINEVYWCNNQSRDDEEAGATALMTEVGSILGINIQYYAHLNWGSLVSIVDTLGGIEVTLDEGIYDYYYTHAVFEPGITYTIDGEQALGLARARHGTDGGDFSRGASQQKIIIGIKNKIFEKDLSLGDILSLAATLGDNLRTNFSLSDMKTLAHLTFEFDFDSMRTISLWPDYMTTGTINGISYVLPKAGVGNYGAIQSYVAQMLSNDPRSYEDPSLIVLNATGESGVAAAERKSLEEEGYIVSNIGDAETGTYTDKYTLYVLSDSVPGTTKLLESRYKIVAKSASEPPSGLPTDYDFVLVLGPSPSDDVSSED